MDDEIKQPYSWSIGDKVRIKANAEELHEASGYIWTYNRDKYLKEAHTIIGIDDVGIELDIPEKGIRWLPILLEPYKEPSKPKFHKGDKVIYYGQVYKVLAVVDVYGYWFCSIDTGDDHLASIPESQLKGVKDKSKTKEDADDERLYDILMSTPKGQIFYSPVYGETVIKEIRHDAVVIVPKNEPVNTKFELTSYYRKKFGDGVRCVLYPSEELYGEYPLEPLKAWEKWYWEEKDSHKRWRADRYGKYWCLDSAFDVISAEETGDLFDDGCFRIGNYFRTEEGACEAANGIRTLIKSIHDRQ